MTMTGRERVRRALEMDYPDRAPRDLWALPGVILYRTEEYQATLKRFPPDFDCPPVKYGKSERAVPLAGKTGR